MTTDEAAALIAGAVSDRGGVWADFGAGDGTFTRALARLIGGGGKIYAVDRDRNAFASLRELEGSMPDGAAHVTPILADFTHPFEMDGVDGHRLQGMIFANSLHFVRDAAAVLARLAAWLEPRGRVVVVEYDRRGASAWVPYPIPISRLPALTSAAGLSTPMIVATQPSAFGGDIYAAVCQRL